MLKQLAGAGLLLGQICLCWAGYSQPDLPWRQYYRVVNQYNVPKAGRPDRVRVGHGRYNMSPHGAELICDFPTTIPIVSNVVWERADLGALRSLDQLYKSVGESRSYVVIGRSNGSTLKLFNVTPIDQGLYRCIATAVEPATNAIVTMFQDVPFYPDFSYRYLSRQLPPLPGGPTSCCGLKDGFKDYHQQRHQSSTVVVQALSRHY